MTNARYQNKKLRLPTWNYSWDGYYFVTIKVQHNRFCFGSVKNKKMILNEYGKIANFFWNRIPLFYKNVKIDKYIIMPDHIHGIIVIGGGWFDPVSLEYPVVPEQCSGTTQGTNYGLVSKVIKSFKEVVTKEIRHKYNDYCFCWQISYYDRIIRNEYELDRIRSYILDNPHNYNV